MSKIEKTSYIDPCTLRCIYSERWYYADTENPLHDWVQAVIETGGVGEFPEGLPPLVCSEVDIRQNAKGLRGSIWLLLSETKTPHKKSAQRNLTGSHVTVEVVYGVKHAELIFNLGPDWLRSMRWVETIEAFRENWSCPETKSQTLFFPPVVRSEPERQNDETEEAA